MGVFPKGSRHKKLNILSLGGEGWRPQKKHFFMCVFPKVSHHKKLLREDTHKKKFFFSGIDQ